MKDTQIYRQLVHKGIGYIDPEFYLTKTLFKFPENEYFEPTNRSEQAYDICQLLADLHLIVKRVTPIYNRETGGYRGDKVSFMYNKNLLY